MREAKVMINGEWAGIFRQEDLQYAFDYQDLYQSSPLSLTMPVQERHYSFDRFPSFFDGLLPEGPQLEALLRQAKLDHDDYFGQLIAVGKDMVGAVTVEEMKKTTNNS